MKRITHIKTFLWSNCQDNDVKWSLMVMQKTWTLEHTSFSPGKLCHGRLNQNVRLNNNNYILPTKSPPRTHVAITKLQENAYAVTLFFRRHIMKIGKSCWPGASRSNTFTCKSSLARTALSFSVSFRWNSFSWRLSIFGLSSRWLDESCCCTRSLSRETGMRCTCSWAVVASGFGRVGPSLSFDWLSDASCLNSRGFCVCSVGFDSCLSS